MRQLDIEFSRRITKTSKNFDNLTLPETRIDLISPYLAIPGLVGFWPMSSIQRSTGNVPNMSPIYGTTNKQDLVNNNGVTFDIYNSFVPYGNFAAASSQSLSVADNTDLDILGTESWAAVPGLTLGGWFRSDDVTQSDGLIAKYNGAGNQRSYGIFTTSSRAQFSISSDGVAITLLLSDAGSPLSNSTWYFLVGKFTPSTSIDLFVNGTKYSNTTSIPASIFSSSADFTIGSIHGGALTFDGDASLCFLSANALPDALINSIFQQTRGAFGV